MSGPYGESIVKRGWTIELNIGRRTSGVRDHLNCIRCGTATQNRPQIMGEILEGC